MNRRQSTRPQADEMPIPHARRRPTGALLPLDWVRGCVLMRALLAALLVSLGTQLVLSARQYDGEPAAAAREPATGTAGAQHPPKSEQTWHGTACCGWRGRLLALPFSSGAGLRYFSLLVAAGACALQHVPCPLTSPSSAAQLALALLCCFFLRRGGNDGSSAGYAGPVVGWMGRPEHVWRAAV